MRRNFVMMVTTALLMFYGHLVWAEHARAVELTMYCNPIESPSLLKSIRIWEKKTGNKVTVLSGPAASSDV